MLINARVEDAPKYIHKQPFGNICLICYFLDFMFCDWEYEVKLQLGSQTNIAGNQFKT